MTGRRVAVVVASCLVSTLVPRISQAAVERLGGELQVPSYTASDQGAADVAARADGAFIVVWTSFAQDGAGNGIFGRRFAASGTGLADEFQVNARTTNYQSQAAIGVAADGDFVVAWQDFGGDGSSYGVFARRFTSSGAALGAVFQVNSYTFSAQGKPALAVNGAGEFVVAWTSYGQDDAGDLGVFARRFDAAGVASAVEFQVNTYTPDNQDTPAATIDDGGGFVVAWASYVQDGSDYGIFARAFTSTGTALATEFQANTYTGGEQSTPTVATDAAGSFVVAWDSANQDGSNNGIFAQRFAAGGVAIASEFQVNAYTPGRQRTPVLASEGDGEFVVAWKSAQDGQFYGVFARAFAADGEPQASELQVNTYTTGFQADPAIDRADGKFVVTWSSFPDQDGSLSGVFAQRFVSLAILDIDANGAVAPLTDGLLVLRFLFGFTDATLTAGAVANDCMRCDAASITGYLGTLI